MFQKLLFFLIPLAVGCAIIDVFGIEWIIHNYSLAQLILIPFAVLFGIVLAELVDKVGNWFDRK
ncbi:MAG: hypothetical protein GTO02_09805 [Candidatus Dadabacteria bacterium]|nr:hypothetical protein [Candidatus Dadabacteria bacterium]